MQVLFAGLGGDVVEHAGAASCSGLLDGSRSRCGHRCGSGLGCDSGHRGGLIRSLRARSVKCSVTHTGSKEGGV